MSKQNSNIPETDATILVYALDAWMNSFPDSNEDDYFDHLEIPIDETVIDYCKSAQKSLPVRIGRVKHVVLDDEFLAWLGATGKPNTSEVRFEYANAISDEDVERLWVKNERDWTVTDFVDFVLILCNPQLPYANFRIPDEVRFKLTGIYSTHFKVASRDIYIHDEMICTDYYYHEFQGYFIDKATSYFESHGENKIDKPPAFRPRIQKSNCGLRVIPIAIREKQKPIYPYKDLLKRKLSPLEVNLPEKQLLPLGSQILSMYPQFLSVSVFPYVIGADDIPEAAESVMKSFLDIGGVIL